MKNVIKTGDVVCITLKKEKKVLEGTLLSSPEFQQDVVLLKLDNGYNVGVNKKNVKTMSLCSAKKSASIKKQKKTVAPATPNIPKKKLPVIALLHTGGTIASKVDYKKGGASANFSADELVTMFPLLSTMVDIHTQQIMQLQSEMMRFTHFNIIAKAVTKAIQQGVQGIIITHGTDTMHYSAAALSFTLEHCPIPIVFVGAQRSADRGSSDAGENLLNAAFFISKRLEFRGVALCMHETMSDDDAVILSGTTARKMHTSRRDAFKPINAIPLARVNYHTEKITVLDKQHPSFMHVAQPKKKVAIKPKLFKETIKVGILKQHPNIFSSVFDMFKGYDGLLIEGTGLGHVANQQVDSATAEHKKIQQSITRLVKNNTVVALASQCIYGRVHFGVYGALRELEQAGVVGHLHNMTPETAFIKLAWLLSNYKQQEVKTLFTQNLRGEITDASSEQFYS